MADKYIFSTLTSPHQYPVWDTSNDIPRKRGFVMIYGGANLPTKALQTPKGVMTRVNENEFAVLESNLAFERHRKRGFLTVEDAPHSIDEVAKDMTPKDGSAPKTPTRSGSFLTSTPISAAFSAMVRA